jgi:hypothetical protein
MGVRRCATVNVTFENVAMISRSVASEHGRDLQVDGLTFSDGGTDRVEVLVTMARGKTGSTRFVVNVTRSNGEDFERELRAKLTRALTKHPS